jgi:hypothetical protein
VGALYLCGAGVAVGCDRLPYPLGVCSVCGAGVKQARGWTWLDWSEFAGRHDNCRDNYPCPLCDPIPGEKYGLLWVGKKYYTPEAFVEEAITMGVSKRIAAIPKQLKLGETRVLFAHSEAIIVTVHGEEVKRGPGIFFSFVPQRVEKIVTQDQYADEDAMAKLSKRGITPVVIEQTAIEEETEP